MMHVVGAGSTEPNNDLAPGVAGCSITVDIRVCHWPRLLCILTNFVGLASYGNTLGVCLRCVSFLKNYLVENFEKYRKSYKK